MSRFYLRRKARNSIDIAEELRGEIYEVADGEVAGLLVTAIDLRDRAEDSDELSDTVEFIENSRDMLYTAMSALQAYIEEA